MSSITQTSGRELILATVKNRQLADWHSPCDTAPEPKDDGFLDKAIEGPVLAVTTFKDEAEALAIANDTLYGLGAGVWSRNGNAAYRMGRETHKVMLDHYQQTKNLLAGYAVAAVRRGGNGGTRCAYLVLANMRSNWSPTIDLDRSKG